jgi:hypothetical protein
MQRSMSMSKRTGSRSIARSVSPPSIVIAYAGQAISHMPQETQAMLPSSLTTKRGCPRVTSFLGSGSSGYWRVIFFSKSLRNVIESPRAISGR